MGFLKRGNLRPSGNVTKGGSLDYIPTVPNPILPTKSTIKKWKQRAEGKKQE